MTREAGPGTPGGAQGTRASETIMVMLVTPALEGRGTLSDTPEQQHGIPPPPLRGEAGLFQTLLGSITVGRRTSTFLW